MNIYRRVVIFLVISIFAVNSVLAQKKYGTLVNTFIGTGGHGHTYPGATTPHGMVQLSPDTRLDGWDGCGGYHYSDSIIYGFSHTHLSGTGVSDYGDILIMPTRGVPSPDNKVYRSKFDHKQEYASPGYYKVLLQDDNILAELTATPRAGFHAYTFPASDKSNILLDLKHRDQVITSSLTIAGARTVEGMRRSKAWSTDQHVYFVLEFSKPFTKSGIWKDEQLQNTGKNYEGENLKAYFSFTTKRNEKILVRVGISSVSIEGARKNLREEISTWDFNKVRTNAESVWEKELGKIEITGGTTVQQRIFYTSLYHTMIVPHLNMDVDRKYRGRDNKIHVAENFTNYSVFSLWDTYRAAHPLYTIIDRQRTSDYINTFLTQYKQGGRLPVWELSSTETDCMIGYHSVSVITDAAVKGIGGFDQELALQAMTKSATWNHFGLPVYIKQGFLEQDDEHESVSKTLEYAYDDWCISKFANLLGHKTEHIEYAKRSQSYRQLVDPVSGFIRPRNNGGWISPFDPAEVNGNYTEANGWQYNFYAPHDLYGYTKLIGGITRLEEKLDSLFGASSKTTGREQADITGLIGQYAHGNEPSHHIAYLYNFVGKPHKTQAMVHRILNTMYHDSPDGLSGNEDCGQMSAWYVLSALGFYPVTPGSGDYILGSPLFSKATIHLENGKKFEIIRKERTSNINSQASADVYWSKLSLNDVDYDNSFIPHRYVADGGSLEFDMTDTPALQVKLKTPTSRVETDDIVLNPVIEGADRSFKMQKSISISASCTDCKIYYTLDSTKPNIASIEYMGPFSIDSSSTIRAIATNTAGQQSFFTTATYIRAPNNWDIKLNTKFESIYPGGGPSGLIDGLYGSTNWRRGDWQGYQGENLDAVIDLLSNRTISKIKVSMLQDTRAWIILPKELRIEISEDGKVFKQVFVGKNLLPVKDLNVQLKTVIATIKPVQARYVRVKGIQYGAMPAWHEGAGGQSHIFVDEIGIE